MKPRSGHLPALLAGAAVLAYANSFLGAFQFDDFNVIVDNPAVHSFGAWRSGAAHGIRPLLKFTYAANWALGPGPAGFHLFNVAVHAAKVGLVYALSRRVFAWGAGTGGGEASASFGALLAAGLFAVHPVQTESVTYVSGRSMSLMAFFYLGSLWSYVRGVETGCRLRTCIASPALFAMAALTKETAVTFPAALLLWEAAAGRGTVRWGEVARRQAVHWAALVCAAALLLAHAGYGRLLAAGFGARAVGDNLLSQAHGVCYLLSRLVAVHRLNIDPDLPVLSSWTPALGAQACLLGALFAVGLAGLRRAPAAGFGILWFFLQLLPTNSVVPRLDVANERHLYLAVWGIFLAAGWCGEALRRRRAAVACAAALILVFLLGGATVARNRAYRTEVALWEATVRGSPGKARAHNNLGYAYQMAGMPGRAKEAYLEALRLDGTFRLARGNLEALLRGEGAVRKGERAYR